MMPTSTKVEPPSQDTADEKMKKLTQQVVGELSANDPLQKMVEIAAYHLKGGLIMVDKGLNIFDTGKYYVQLFPIANQGELFCREIAKSENGQERSPKEIAKQIKSIIMEYQKKTGVDAAHTPLFCEEVFEPALQGKDPQIAAFREALKRNEELSQVFSHAI
jgi:hypothetical protein